MVIPTPLRSNGLELKELVRACVSDGKLPKICKRSKPVFVYVLITDFIAMITILLLKISFLLPIYQLSALINMIIHNPIDTPTLSIAEGTKDMIAPEYAWNKT